MEWMETVVSVTHVLAAIALVALVLLQQGKGADAGAAFGSGASQTVFGSQGSGNFLTKMTTWIAVIFFVTSFSLAVFAKQRATSLQADEGMVPSLVSVPAQEEDSDAVAPDDGAVSDSAVESRSDSDQGPSPVEAVVPELE
ncbi:MAG: preprotein translocase subunit SecG [Gammaproteobacteria bacterium]|nr:MAG: preprotein translocase subunit SecG [Gammaproteobacteria bacterium]